MCGQRRGLLPVSRVGGISRGEECRTLRWPTPNCQSLRRKERSEEAVRELPMDKQELSSSFRREWPLVIDQEYGFHGAVTRTARQ